MMEEGSPAPLVKRNRWREVSLALLVGIIVLGASVFLVAVLQAPIGPPIEAVPLFVWNTTAASVAVVLLWHDNKYGYAASILTGILVIISLMLIGMGVYGHIQPDSSPVGPLSYAALALALITTTSIAWRKRATIQTTQVTEKPIQ
jgi:hypothetical protein